MIASDAAWGLMADILSQEEIDALLEVVDEDGDTSSIDVEENQQSEQRQIIVYDLNAQTASVKSSSVR